MPFAFRKRAAADARTSAHHVQPEEAGSGSGSGAAAAAAASTGAEAVEQLKHFQEEHKLDPNLPLEELNAVDSVVAAGDAEKGAQVEATLVEDDSPYPEVRSAVRNYDEDLPSSTVRAWVIGLVLCTVGSAVNMLFSLRNPSVTVTTFVIQLIAYPIGIAWDMVFPDREFNVWGCKFNLRPGKFNYKEHVVIVAMSNAAYGGGFLYATDVLIAQQVWYKQNFGWAFQILFGITTLCTGFGLAGLARRFLVWPAAMIWPSDLVNCTLFYTLHDHSESDPSKTDGWRIGRYRWFLYVFGAGFVWYWFPGWIFQGLSYFTFICWAAPNNVVVNKLFGGLHGYGLVPLSFDWTVISGYALSPLIPPWHAIANTVGGMLVFFVALSMGLHFSGAWWADYFPVQSSSSFDNTGARYNVSRILNPATLQFDEARYRAYSPVFLSTQFALCYGLSFAAVAAVIVHVALYHGADIRRQLRESRAQQRQQGTKGGGGGGGGDDVHMRLMRRYPDTPDWWYLAVFVAMVAASFGVVCGWPTGFPAWAYVVCILIAAVWTVPIGIIQAVTNIQLGLNVFTEFVVGYMLPGRPLAMMMFKNYGYLCMSQALYFAQDLKMGHYMKVPPRTMFWAQLVAAVWSAAVQVAVMNWALGSIPGVCTDDQPDGYICPNASVFFTASVIWGAVGPRRMFGRGAIYAGLQWFWLAGALLPLACWLLARRYPRSAWRWVSAPLVFGGTGMIPPATVYTYLCWGAVGAAFQWFLRRRRPGWWLQYNYVTSAALDCGLVVSTIVVFFGLYLSKAQPPQWFGNVAAAKTLDQMGTAIKSFVAEGETFGPTEWP